MNSFVDSGDCEGETVPKSLDCTALETKGVVTGQGFQLLGFYLIFTPNDLHASGFKIGVRTARAVEFSHSGAATPSLL